MYFTKRHFIFFAEFLKTTEANTKDEFKAELIKHFEIDNPKFSKQLFNKACLNTSDTRVSG
jgi:hypothetical protein